MKETKNIKKGFISVFLFYFLVAFEFAYMAGPFAIYFYSVYSPVLKFFNKIPKLAWLIQFFLPHVVRDTNSFLIHGIEILGVICSIFGFLFFVIGACQIYYSKLTKKGAVLGGLYTYIRHPQYTSFIICSFGLLLLWPRYIVIFLFTTLVFAYIILARTEEIECEKKFGANYIEYERRTGRFFPKISIDGIKKRSKYKTTKTKVIRYLIIYLITLIILLTGAFFLHKLTLKSLYAVYEKNSVTVAICKMNSIEMNEVIQIAKKDKKVLSYLQKYDDNQTELNYILPTEWFAAEIPMNGVVYRSGHSASPNYNHDQYKLILTYADLREECKGGLDILNKTMSMDPVVEVWVDIKTKRVIKVLSMPDQIKYDGIPEAIF